ncbi:glucosamine inositolphosphorylceramide transferase family protein [Prevotella communis]|uniref:glucosamine inositolphosphorylceramide transferase family protein n=1 Tax=Prevotella communis TaxID=2913614 RepID=UPI001EDB5B18|nr:hypothetical protein [Prevotella communis]UKK56818.1 hypothetical protein L6476_00750 [Prevotella communis]
MQQTECYKIQLLQGDKNLLFNIKQLEVVHQIRNTTNSLSLLPKVILADPFLFVKEDILYLFYESKMYGKDGVIKMICTKNLKDWSKPITVLQESFHLSYPFVFKDGDSVYMIPETCASREIRLYKADDDSLSHFSFLSTIVKHDERVSDVQIDYSDSSLYIKDDVYYLMTSIKENNRNNLLLYYSKNLTGPFIKHPSSPIVTSMKYGRNAGCLLEKEGKLYRVAQDCVNRYGDNVHLFMVDTINEYSYQEHLLNENIIPSDDNFYSEGGHQFNFVFFKNNFVVATDAREYREFPLARLLYKLGRVYNKLF